MNKEFERFQKFIRKIDGKESTWHCPEGEELSQLCYEHAKSNTTGIIGEENIVAVHPYHHELRSLMHVKSTPIVRLENLLRTADGERFRKILLESRLHYAWKSHQLVDQGLIDHVIFTVDFEASPINPYDLQGFSGSRVNYVGGSYGFVCVRAAIAYISKHAPFSVRPIKDATLFKQPSFWDIVDAKLSAGDVIFDGYANPGFYIPHRLYLLMRGVKTSDILGE